MSVGRYGSGPIWLSILLSLLVTVPHYRLLSEDGDICAVLVLCSFVLWDEVEAIEPKNLVCW